MNILILMKMNFLLIFLTRNKCLVWCLALAIISSSFDVSVLAKDHNNRYLQQIKVGFVSNLTGRWGGMAQQYVEMAIFDFYNKHSNYKTRLVLEARDSHNDVVTSANIVEDLIKKEKVVAIIGPETSQEAQFDISLGEKYKVPIISYSASSPTLSCQYFIQATQDDSSQVEAISSLIQAFGWREVTPVYVNNEFGGGIIPFLVDALQQSNTRIPYRSVISSSATDEDITAELSKLSDKQTRVFLVHMDDILASRVFKLAHHSGMMSSDYVWIVTSSISNAFGALQHEAIQSMQGVLGVKSYVPKTKAVEIFKDRWRKNVSLDTSYLEMSLYGLWAYDATFLLAKAVEQVHGESNFGPQLIQKLVNADFPGLSGNFRVVNGRLQTDAFQIINVVGTGEKQIGFWTSKKGLVRKLDGSNESLGNIIWPGDSTTIPKGWVIPENEKPLKVGVPIKIGFTEFVEASANDSKGTPKGFCIDVFDEVKSILGYNLPVRYFPDNSSYDDLISKVHSKEYDAVVGDTTITSNRSLYVDFTAPYLEAEVLMVVPAIKDRNKVVWAFLRPLSWKLWITTLCFFVLIAFVVWVNEYQVNDEFRADSWRSQIGLCLFFSFSTMVFSHKEAPKSNLSRLVMVCWIFTLLLLTQSYTATLASTLTVEKLQYTDINALLRERKNVGCQSGSFVNGFLLKMGFFYSNMLNYDTEEELHDLLSKGSDGGGIDAAFDETPYINLFLAHYCSHQHYMSTVVLPASRTDGFAFAFPLGSPLAPDISRALLKLRDGGNMTKIWNKWMNQSAECSIAASSTAQSSAPQSSAALDLDSFVALFAITGGASVVVIALKLTFFLHENRPVWRRNRNGSRHRTLIESLQELNRAFHKKSAVSPDFGISTLHKDSIAAVELDVIYNAGMTLSTASLSHPDHWGDNWHHLAS